MPPVPTSSNRAMFLRILRRFISGNPGRLAVMLVALGAGAAITAALLNLKVDAQRRLTTEFAAFGPNIVIAPRDRGTTVSLASQATLNEPILDQIPTEWNHRRVDVAALLYLVVDVSLPNSSKSQSVVATGLMPFPVFKIPPNANPTRIEKPDEILSMPILCVAGAHVAQKLGVQQQANGVVDWERLTSINLVSGDKRGRCGVVSSIATGGPEDDQIKIGMGYAQRLAGLPNRLSLVELTVPGTPEEITSYLADLRQRLPDADVRPIRQFTEGEARIYNRISGVLTATVVLVLVLTALCVMAAMTNVAMERRNDVGLMKAIGGATRRVLRLFLVEAALLGLASGVVGAALGIALSMWLGKAVFGLAARPRLIVYPVAVALTVIVAIAGAYPLRRLANIRPASVFRGEA